MLKRRLFLSALAAGATSSILPTTAFSAVLADNGLLAEKFSTLVGSEFHFRNTVGDKSCARLVAFDNGPDSPGLEQFSVVFEGDGLAEGLHDIHHLGTGKLTVFCMPSTSAALGNSRQRVYFSNFS
jgi:hypothetical protein